MDINKIPPHLAYVATLPRETLMSAKPSHRSLPFLLHGFPGLFTDTSEHTRFFTFEFSDFHFLVVGSMRQIKLTHVSLSAHVKLASRIVSYRFVTDTDTRP